MSSGWRNKLYFADNLDILRRLDSETIDLVYLDPPFNSKATYNLLYKEYDGSSSNAQVKAFDDFWHWNEEAEKQYGFLVELAPPKVSEIIQAFRGFLGTNDMMAYLIMMCVRLVELHRVLKQSGSLYLHCDSNASHYLKVVLDSVFGPAGFRNEIIWHYSGWNGVLKTSFNRRHDSLLFYAKSAKQQVFDSFKLPWSSEEEYIKVRKQKVRVDEHGCKYVLSDAGGGKRIRRYISEAVAYGRPVDDVWNIDKLNNSSKERLGYPTQKPEALLERVIMASSREGDIVLDPFCGCGTSIGVAERLNRRWIGIDITHLAISVIKYRLERTFGRNLAPYEVLGAPRDLSSANALALQDRYQFQYWVLSMISARPLGERRKGADGGVDGYFYFLDSNSSRARKVIIQVKSGRVNVAQIRDLKGAMQRERAVIALFITLENPSRAMITEAVTSGFYVPGTGLPERYPAVQILTIEELLNGKTPNVPAGISH